MQEEFPCIDEPNAKAEFNITLKIPNKKELTALSNTQIIEEKIENNFRVIKFEKTPIMSTYLLAFFIGEVDYIERIINIDKDIKFRVYTPKGESDNGKFALDVGCKALKLFSDFFGINYPLNKMDMIAIPDFSAGAMENWGLVTYRSAYLLYNENTTSQAQKLQIAYVICHELAHQWFGKLVTMDWWSGLWLNEGFATWVGWMAVAEIFPEWKSWEIFYDDEFRSALTLDALDSSHPIDVDIENTSQIGEIFDAISYSKGSCIIGMLVDFMGIDRFKSGIREYLNKYKYANAKTNDLWDVLSKHSDYNIRNVMYEWTKNMGYPLVCADIRNNKLVLKQNKFMDKDKNDKNNCSNIWSIPLDILTDKNETKELFSYENLDLDLDLTNINWLKLNCKEQGFFITFYSDELLERLKTPIKNKILTTLNRAEIIDSISKLMKYGYYKLDFILEFINNVYNNETEYLVLKIIINFLIELKSIWFDEPIKQEKINNILNNILNRLNDTINYLPNNKESLQNSLYRTLLINLGILNNNKNIINKLNKLEISGDLRQLIYINKIQSGTLQDIDDLILIYNKSTDALEMKQILIALGHSKDEKVLMDLLKNTFNLELSIIKPFDIKKKII